MIQDEKSDELRDRRFLKVEDHSETYHLKVNFDTRKVQSEKCEEGAIEEKAVEISKVEEEKVEKETIEEEKAEKENIGDRETEKGAEKLAEVVKKTEEPRRRQKGLKVWFLRAGSIMVGLLAVVAVVLAGTRLLGFRTFTVMSGSMEPEYPVGAMVYVRPVNYQELKVGDVISYVADDEKTVITHRIVKIEADKKDNSVLRFQTKGDSNNVADAKMVHYKNVLGVPIMTIPMVGYVAHGVQRPPGIYIMLVAGTLLLAWAFLPSTLEERRRNVKV